MKSNNWATQKNECVITLAAPMPMVLEAGKLPKRVKVLNWGENLNARNEPVIVNDRLLANMKSQVYPFHMVALDFEHNTTPGTKAYAESKEPRDVAGYVKFDVVPKDGVYMLIHSWTPLGIEKAHNYVDVSATPLTDKQGNVVGITSVALCRVGAVPGMEFKDVPLSALLVSTNQNKDKLMRDKLIAMFKLAPESTDDQIMEAVEAAMKAVPAPTPLSVDVQKVVSDAVTAAIMPLSTDVANFKAELVKRDKQQVISDARLEGKVVALSADAVNQLSLDALKDHVKALTVTVPLNAITPAHTPENKPGVISEEQRAIALSCGQDPDKVFGTAK
jgi:phage I-like protein